jgi:hypothetical protein
MRAQKIFVEEIPIIGEVPMCFYMPDSPERKDLERMIVSHGGRITEWHECFTYQI